MIYWTNHIYALERLYGEKLCLIPNTYNVFKLTLRTSVFFIVCMLHKSYTLVAGPINSERYHRENAHNIQRAIYTRYGKVPCNKTQGILLHDDMMGDA